MSLKLTWPDLLIENISRADCARWLEAWAGIVDGRVAPAFMNKFGSWFLRRPAGEVEMLDVFSGSLERVAESYEAFITQVNQQAWQEVYLLSRLVLRLHEAGKVPGDGECYALVPHPAIGGPDPNLVENIDPDLVMVMDIGGWQYICAQLVGRNG